MGIFLLHESGIPGGSDSKESAHNAGVQFSSFQSLSRVQLCNPMDCSTPDFPVHYQLPELAQTHVCRIGDAIRSSHPLSSPSPLAFNLSQHQSLFLSQFFQSVGQSFRFSISPSNEYSGLISFRIDLISLQSKGLSRVFSNSTVQNYQFFGAQFSLWSNSHIHTWPLEKP